MDYDSVDHQTSFMKLNHKLILKLLKKKNLPVDIFLGNNSSLSVESPLEAHVNWAFQSIYRHPYPEPFAW